MTEITKQPISEEKWREKTDLQLSGRMNNKLHPKQEIDERHSNTKLVIQDNTQTIGLWL
jgi:hypothetical protein